MSKVVWFELTEEGKQHIRRSIRVRTLKAIEDLITRASMIMDTTFFAVGDEIRLDYHVTIELAPTKKEVEDNPDRFKIIGGVV